MMYDVSLGRYKDGICTYVYICDIIFMTRGTNALQHGYQNIIFFKLHS